MVDIILITRIIFWLILPLVCVYFRIKKKISTGFAFSGVLTSFILGLIFIGTFQEKPVSRFVKLMNQKAYEQAENELRYIIQQNPENIKNIDTSKILNPIKFERMKNKIEKEYLKIVEKYLNNYELDDRIDCNALPKQKTKLAELNNALRLVNMAESIGKEQPFKQDKLKKKIKRGEAIINRIEERCQ